MTRIVPIEDMPVWGGTLTHAMPREYRTQVRVIVAAPSAAAARRYLHDANGGRPVTRTQWDRFWCDTANRVELTVARAAGEGVVLYRPDVGGYPQAHRAGLGGTWLPWWADWPAQDA